MKFQKGQSGNPGGKQPHKDGQIKEKLTPHVEDAVEALVRGLRSKNNYMSAAKEILDRVYGKSIQRNQHDVDQTLRDIFLNGVKLGSRDEDAK